MTKSDRTGLNVCVFCSANELDKKYVKPTEEFARLLAENGHTLVYGGSDRGLMRVMATGMQGGGAKVIGISVEYLRSSSNKDADELIIAKTLSDRKRLMLERSDVIVLLVGGLGSLDELTEILEFKKHEKHDKTVIIMNTDGFYEGLRTQLMRMEQEGFFWHPLDEYVLFTETPQQTTDIINQLLWRSS